MGSVGQLFLVIIETAVLCIPLGLSLWALLDCAKRPGWAWALTPRSQAVWMASILCGILVMPIGLAISGWYLLRIRPQIAGVESGRLLTVDTPSHRRTGAADRTDPMAPRIDPYDQP